ncbi:MAG: 3'-5' exonuclease [Lachnospiraceae bacterium]|nr:3'-5' exonuclease [Lachnospiraceae bacterium]
MITNTYTDTYISIDLETTGLNPKLDKIIEIGAVKVVEGKIVDTFSALVNPGRKLEQRIVELTGITDSDLENAPYIDEVLPLLITFLEDYILLGHSILFDYSFLKKAAVDKKLTFEKQAIDTLKIARKYLADLEHRSLDYLCEYYQIPHRAHRALADAEATSMLYQRLTEAFYQEQEPLFMPTQLSFKIKRDTPATKAQKERLYRLLEQHRITPEVDVEKLTRSEASRFTDKLLAKYGR